MHNSIFLGFTFFVLISKAVSVSNPTFKRNVDGLVLAVQDDDARLQFVSAGPVWPTTNTSLLINIQAFFYVDRSGPLSKAGLFCQSEPLEWGHWRPCRFGRPRYPLALIFDSLGFDMDVVEANQRLQASPFHGTWSDVAIFRADHVQGLVNGHIYYSFSVETLWLSKERAAVDVQSGEVRVHDMDIPNLGLGRNSTLLLPNCREREVDGGGSETSQRKSVRSIEPT